MIRICTFLIVGERSGPVAKRTSYLMGLAKSSNLSFPYKAYHHHHVVPLARISLTLPHHFSLSFITSGRSSGLHPVSSHSCCMYFRAGRHTFAWPYAGFHRCKSLMSSSFVLQQRPARLFRLTSIVFVMETQNTSTL